ncbi:MAG TPA: glycosyltransferase family A protein [Mycobacteriales bacterium]|nr:glycosyltransferase family A protein [Mycobacteriales bacterium]
MRRCTAALLVDGWPGDVRTCVEALVRHAPDDVVVVLLENGRTDAGDVVHALAQEHPGRVEELHVEQPAGWGEARAALLRADVAEVHVVLDASSVLEGDALTPLLEALTGDVVGAGWRGADVEDGWTSFADAGPGEVEALLSYLMAVRREAALATPPPAKARTYRNADLEWSYLLREAGGRLVVPDRDLPVRQDRHRGYHDSDPDVRDRESRRTYDRFLQRFRGREDLRLTR